MRYIRQPATLLTFTACFLTWAVSFVPRITFGDDTTAYPHVATASTCGTRTSPIRIMPIGDSITESRRGYLSYRFTLWRELKAAGCEVDLVGSRSGVSFGLRNSPSIRVQSTRPFDQDHQSYWGWTTDQVARKLSTYAKAYSPDYALIHLGTNDLLQKQGVSSTVRDVVRIVNKLRAENDQIVIFVAKVIPCRGVSQVAEYNSLLESRMKSLSRASSRIVVVDMHSRFSSLRYMQSDGIHPNMRGEVVIGKRFARALLRHLQS